MFWYDKDQERVMQHKKREIIRELEETKNRILKELSGVDKVTLTRLREVLADYNRIDHAINEKIKNFMNNGNVILDGAEEVAQLFREEIRKINDLENQYENLGFKTPQMYGAKGDGIADDTTAIKTAIANGGVIVFPKGKYKISETLNVQSNTTFIFDNAEILLYVLDTKLENNIRYTSYKMAFCVENVENVSFHGLTLTGNLEEGLGHQGLPTWTGHAESESVLFVNNAKNIYIENFTLKNFTGIVTDGLDLYRPDYMTDKSVVYHYVRLCNIENLKVDGLKYENCSTEAVLVFNCPNALIERVFMDEGNKMISAVDFWYSENAILKDSYFKGYCYGNAVNIYSKGVTVNNCILIGVDSQLSVDIGAEGAVAMKGVYPVYPENVTIKNCHFINGGITSVYLYDDQGYNCEQYNNPLKNLLVTDCFFVFDKVIYGALSQTNASCPFFFLGEGNAKVQNTAIIYGGESNVGGAISTIVRKPFTIEFSDCFIDGSMRMLCFGDSNAQVTLKVKDSDLTIHRISVGLVPSVEVRNSNVKFTAPCVIKYFNNIEILDSEIIYNGQSELETEKDLIVFDVNTNSADGIILIKNNLLKCRNAVRTDNSNAGTSFKRMDVEGNIFRGNYERGYCGLSNPVTESFVFKNNTIEGTGKVSIHNVNNNIIFGNCMPNVEMLEIVTEGVSGKTQIISHNVMKTNPKNPLFASDNKYNVFMVE